MVEVVRDFFSAYRGLWPLETPLPASPERFRLFPMSYTTSPYSACQRQRLPAPFRPIIEYLTGVHASLNDTLVRSLFHDDNFHEKTACNLSRKPLSLALRSQMGGFFENRIARFGHNGIPSLVACFRVKKERNKMAKSNAKTVENVNENESDVNTEVANTNTVDAAKKRQSKATVTYVMPDGSEKNFPTVGAVAIRFELTDGSKIDYALDGERNANVDECARQQGFVTRFQRGYQALKEIDAVKENIGDTKADLEGGIWLEIGTGEPRVTNLITAIVMALEAQGETVDNDRKKGIGEKLANDENLRKEMRERPAIKANLAKLAADAAAERARKALASASENASEAITI